LADCITNISSHLPVRDSIFADHSLENRIPQPMSVAALPHHPVQRRQRLGGILSYYHRAAA
jgi:hypothetical protein